MLPSIDTYLHEQIEGKLKIILSNRYIIEEILKGIQPSIAENFMKAYAGEDGMDIPIIYTMPQEKNELRGSIYIGLREGEEDRPSMGNLEGTYDFKEDGMTKQKSTVQWDDESERMYFEVNETIGELINVEGITFAARDQLSVEGNRIYFLAVPEIMEMDFMVNYVPSSGDEIGFKKGFTATEFYSVLVVSTNMDTVRCLDLIVKAILIMMRSNKEDNTAFLLQKIKFGQIEEVETGNQGEEPQMLYGRESIVSYVTSYSLDAPILDAVLEKINLHIKYEEGGEQNG
jgi:hypothetical protein